MAGKKKVKKPTGKSSKFLRFLWIAFIILLLLAPLLVYTVKVDFLGLYGGMPELKELENPQPDLSSELYSEDGVLLGKYYRYNRSPIAYEDLSEEMIETLLVTEDIRFKEHSGIDLRGLARAVWGKVTFSGGGGGSTITMQLAENLFRTNTENQGALYFNRTIGQVITKLKEWILAVQLERNYTKEEILAMYLNTIPFGNNAYGIKVAADTYFGKEPWELNHKESAVLVALINKPTGFNPIRNPERAMAKRHEILYNLNKYGKIDDAAFDSLKVSEFGLNFKADDHNEGLATYFRSVIRNQLRDWASENGYDLYNSGLRIYTTINSRMQKHAELAIEEHMTKLQETFNDHWDGRNPWIDEKGREVKSYIGTLAKRTEYYRSLVDKYGSDSDSVEILMNEPRPMRVFSWQGEIDTVMSAIDSIKYFQHFLHAGFMAMNPENGHIKAWVGGIDHQYFKYDHVMQGKRQPGSTFKPILYATAIEMGYTPCYTVRDVPVTFKTSDENGSWTPDNYSGRFSGEEYTLRQGLARSLNSIAAFVMQKVGPESVVNMARRLGIESSLDPVPALALGSSDLSVFELAGAYGTFVNEGIYTKPMFITRIEDKNGNLIHRFAPQTVEALNEETAYLMLHMLRGGTEEEGGTSLGLSREIRYENEVGAKTGTTNNYSDGWFVGVTKDLVAVTWVGGDDRRVRFRTGALGTGGRMALPIYDKFMRTVYKDEKLDITKGAFKRPDRPLSVELNCDRYRDRMFEDIDSLATEENEELVDDIF
ncbi:penicillin-binding protein 1A [Roseivirga sp. BDSF3-8]|uniref:penicillin-binding protein 1A n=1 Tax=Roseivirga sp. BDSF3-8 TaxID=3241598 RepID=UPI003531D8B0